jgi:hypothetical protein
MPVFWRKFAKSEWVHMFARRLVFLRTGLIEAVAQDIGACEHDWAGAGDPEDAAEFYAARDLLAQAELSGPRCRPSSTAPKRTTSFRR